MPTLHTYHTEEISVFLIDLRGKNSPTPRRSAAKILCVFALKSTPFKRKGAKTPARNASNRLVLAAERSSSPTAEPWLWKTQNSKAPVPSANGGSVQRPGSATCSSNLKNLRPTLSGSALTAGLATARRIKPRMARMGTDQKYPCDPRNPWSKKSLRYLYVTLSCSKCACRQTI